MMLENTIRQNGLETILIRRLEYIKNEVRMDIIPFYLIIHRLCSAFCITKQDCWELLSYLQDRGFVEVVPFHGVRIKLSD